MRRSPEDKGLRRALAYDTEENLAKRPGASGAILCERSSINDSVCQGPAVLLGIPRIPPCTLSEESHHPERRFRFGAEGDGEPKQTHLPQRSANLSYRSLAGTSWSDGCLPNRLGAASERVREGSDDTSIIVRDLVQKLSFKFWPPTSPKASIQVLGFRLRFVDNSRV